MCLPVHACDLGNGGAVELSWSLRPASDAGSRKFVGCEGDPDPEPGPNQGKPIWRITKIQLHWQAQAETTPPGSHAWSCDDNHGATRFEIDQGPTNLWVTPQCAPLPGASPSNVDVPAEPDTYIAPAIVQRDVIRGEAVTLGAVELVVSVDTCPKPGSCVCPTVAQVAADHTSR